MLTYIQPFDAVDSFPDLERAHKDPNGLLAIGGDLTVARLLEAYRKGIFPWFNEDQPIMWWSPDPRMVLLPEELHVSRSLRKNVKRIQYDVSFDQAFSGVINACSQPRQYSRDTWITDSMKEAYLQLHLQGYAHSVEIWHENKLVGGLYGIAIGKMFFGESMFSLRTDVSKMAFWVLSHVLQRNGFPLIDCQVYSEHLETLGAREISRKFFAEQVERLTLLQSDTNWQLKKTSLQGLLLQNAD